MPSPQMHRAVTARQEKIQPPIVEQIFFVEHFLTLEFCSPLEYCSPDLTMNVCAPHITLSLTYSMIVFMMSAFTSPTSVVCWPLPIHLDTLFRVVYYHTSIPWWRVPKGYMAYCYFLFLQEQIKDIIIIIDFLWCSVWAE
jgi:hypothetical protein